MPKPTLLPAGIYDHLAPEASTHRNASSNLVKSFESFGYRYVSPPLVEFEEGMLSGAATSLSQDTFRLMDPESQQMLAIRSDITTQIARIATSRIGHSELPFRLSYAGDVLRVGGNSLNHERQLTQAGIELIGADDLIADIEVIRVAVNALVDLGIQHIAIDFSLPKLKGVILAEMELNAQMQKELEEAIARKDPKIIQALAGKQTALLLALCAPSLTLKEFLAITLPKDAKPLAKQLKELVTLVKEHFPSLHVTIDPLEARQGGYHSGVAFALFARDAKGEIGRGGRYQILTGDPKETLEAVGCSLYVNMLTSLLPDDPSKERIFLPLGTSEEVAAKLRSDEYVTIYATQKAKDVKAEAKRLSCHIVWKDDKIVKA